MIEQGEVRRYQIRWDYVLCAILYGCVSWCLFMTGGPDFFLIKLKFLAFFGLAGLIAGIVHVSAQRLYRWYQRHF